MTEPAAESIHQRLIAIAARDPHATVLQAPGATPMSHGSLAAHVEHVRSRFDEWGIRRGDVVAAPAFERPVAAALVATAPVASTFSLLPDTLNVGAYDELLRRMRARAVLVPSAGEHPIAVAARERGIARIAVDAGSGEAGAFRLRLADAGRTLDGSPPAHSPAWAYVCVTSGTTDRPKIVPYRHQAVLGVADAMGALLRVTPDDVSAAVTPLHLANGMRNALLLPALHGASVLCLPEARVDTLLEAIRDDRVSYFFASFTFLRAILERLGPRGRVRSRRLRFVRIASGTLDLAEIAALEEAFGVPALTGLAMTETGVVTHQPLPPAPRTPGTLGPPLLAEIRIADDAGRDVARGEVGEVMVRGMQVFDGYLDDDALNRSTRIDGWFRPGDLARWDDDGNLVLVGRSREMINRGGDKISPLEVDRALRAIGGVADAAAFGVPHPTLGEEVVAAVVRAPGATATETDLMSAAAERLGARRAPRRIWFVDALPRNAAGKVMRSRLPDRGRVSCAGAACGERRRRARARRWKTRSPRCGAPCWASRTFVRTTAFDALGGDDATAARLGGRGDAVFGVASRRFDRSTTRPRRVAAHGARHRGAAQRPRIIRRFRRPGPRLRAAFA